MTHAYPAQHTCLMSNSSNKSAIIGLGNVYRNDDGVGIVILESLKYKLKNYNFDFLNFGIASFDLANVIKRFKKTLLIDAVNSSNLKPGELIIAELKDVKYHINEKPVSTHEINLAGLFEIIKNIKIPSKIYIAGIQAKDTSFGKGLSSNLKNNLDSLTNKICRFVCKNLSVNAK